MGLLAISTLLAILAILGLIVGLVVLGVVIFLLTEVLRPAREISRLAADAPNVAPFLTNGVQGVGELSRTRNLCAQVPPLALAYLEIVNGSAPPPAAAKRAAPGPGPMAGSSTGISAGKP